MKNLLHNIQILAMLALTMIGIQSCSDDLHDVGDVQVNFTATLPTDTRTRAFGMAEQVNTLVVGIFKKGGCRCTHQQRWQLELYRPPIIPYQWHFGRCAAHIGAGTDIQFRLLGV